MARLIRNTLQQKSNIQLELEKVQMASKLQDYILNFMESYDFDDVVFGNKNNTPCEIENGYMAITDRFDTLLEAIKTVDNPNAVIRCTQDGYFTGNCYNTLTECGNNVIFDVKNLEYIY